MKRNITAFVLRMLGIAAVVAFDYWIGKEDYGLAAVALVIAARFISVRPEDI